MFNVRGEREKGREREKRREGEERKEISKDAKESMMIAMANQWLGKILIVGD